ncbi:MAG TPA: extracellular solute-binding protein [Candidatus Binatia bacterium]|nr:extracellular solute-binding protein [Candidatus Binatia bacterium]
MKPVLFALCALVLMLLWQPVLARPQSTLNTSIMEAAKKEKKLVLYTTADLPQVLNIASQFVRKYPFIELELFPATNAALLERIHHEARAGMPSWDVLSGDGSVLRPLLERSMVAPYRSPQRPAITNGLIDRYGYWSGYYVNPYVLGYNTLAVKREDIPKTYEELLEPRWRLNQIAMDSEGHGLLSGLMRAWGLDKAIAYLQQLAKQKPRMAASSVANVQFVREGKSRLVIAHAPVIQAERRRGTAIDWRPLEPVIAEINAVVLSAQAPHPNGARLFIDFILSNEGQSSVAGFQQFTIRQDARPWLSPPIARHKWVIERPDEAPNFRKAGTLYQEILGLR